MAVVSLKGTILLLTGYGVTSMETKGLQPGGMPTDRADGECAVLWTANAVMSFPDAPYPVITK